MHAGQRIGGFQVGFAPSIVCLRMLPQDEKLGSGCDADPGRGRTADLDHRRNHPRYEPLVARPPGGRLIFLHWLLSSGLFALMSDLRYYSK